MKKFSILIIFLIFLLQSCGQAREQESTQTQNEASVHSLFFENLKNFCGTSLSGTVFMDADNPQYEGRSVVFDFAICDDSEIRVKVSHPSETAITIVLTSINDELLLKHDMRDAENMPLANTMYGGFADASGSEFRHVFPVHNFGRDMWPGFENKSWEICLTPEEGKLEYMEMTDKIVNKHYIFEIPQL